MITITCDDNFLVNVSGVEAAAEEDESDMIRKLVCINGVVAHILANSCDIVVPAHPTTSAKAN